MKICESWLREWVSSPCSPQEISNQLTMAGLEVDALYPVAGLFDHVVVALVLNTKPHPKADKLTICEVDAGGNETLQIVCGAANVRADLRVALAQIGAVLPTGIEIKEASLRGELSQGMLCSVSELGLDDHSDGIMELPADAPIGMDLREYLDLNDFVYDIDLTPNRADCLSVLGVAREIAAINHLSLKSRTNDTNQQTIDHKLTICLDAPKGCPQYAGRVIRGINTEAQTPVWMKERLRRCGLRTVHPVVDVTNYVMLELGQPMHAFDLQKIQGNIHVRYAGDREPFTLLDGQQIELDSRVLVIADSEKILAMAGVMGGAESAVALGTQDIFLESAFFNPISIAGVARRFGLNSDSSQRYERGVDPQQQVLALERATSLLKQIVGGDVGPVEFTSEPEYLPPVKKIVFDSAEVLRLSGVEMTDDEMVAILERLGMLVTHHYDYLDVIVPSYRFDIGTAVDLVEEIIRLHGYHRIPSLPICGPIQAGKINPEAKLLIEMGGFLQTRGYRETMTYSFVDPELQRALYPEQQTKQLLNPISSELSEMRLGMWPGLLASMVYNAHRQQSGIKLFESGVVFSVQQGQVRESSAIAGLITGAYGQLNWSEVPGQYDFYDMKGDLEALFGLLDGHNLQFQKAVHSALHPGKSAKITAGADVLGWMGVLHPQILDMLEMDNEIILFELSIDGLLKKNQKFYRTISKYPQTRRDLSLIVEEQISAMDIERAIREIVDAPYLKSFYVFDVYRGESIPENKKSLAIALTFQDDNRTLIDEEVHSKIETILKKLEERFSAVLRALT